MPPRFLARGWLAALVFSIEYRPAPALTVVQRRDIGKAGNLAVVLLVIHGSPWFGGTFRSRRCQILQMLYPLPPPFPTAISAMHACDGPVVHSQRQIRLLDALVYLCCNCSC